MGRILQRLWLVALLQTMVRCLSFGAGTAEECEPAREAALAKLTPLLKAAAKDKEWGFTSGDDISKAILDKPFHVYSINLPTEVEKDVGAKLDDLLAPSEEWIYPVMMNGSNRVVMIVRKLNTQWKVVYLGNERLARDLGRLRNRFPADGPQATRLVSVTRIRSWWFTVKPHAVENLSPLNDVRLPSGEAVVADPSLKELIPSSKILTKLLTELRAVANEPSGILR